MHRQNSEFKFPPKIWSARSAVCSAFPPQNPDSARIRPPPRGAKKTEKRKGTESKSLPHPPPTPPLFPSPTLFRSQKYGRREAPSVLHPPHKTLILQGFATLRVAQKRR